MLTTYLCIDTEPQSQHMIKVSDYIIRFLERENIRHIFMFTGGMTMHLNDSVGYSRTIKPICMLHEQGCTFAAESYARITNNLGVTFATCGPGATNTVTGIACSWIESTPLLVITGQCKRADMADVPELRQMGVQEVRITEVVKPITKYAAIVSDPNSIRYELEKAVYLCRSGRRGPCLLDIPVDVQGCMVKESELSPYIPERRASACSPEQMDEVVRLLSHAKRPVIYAGAGVDMAGARDDFRALVEKLNIPVLIHWNALDLLENEHPHYAGRPGAVGQRAANFTLQNADVLITIGTRLALLQTGYNFDGYARNAKHVMVDIDPAELNKKNLHPALKICADAGDFIRALAKHPNLHIPDCTEWTKQTKTWMNQYPPIKEEWRSNQQFVNSYCLAECISDCMSADDVYVGGRAGTCVDVVIQAFKVKKDQRVYVTKGLSSMGNGLPAAIGGAYATGRKIVSINGDGGFVMNIQELEVVRRDNLPIKFFILDNNGYSTIRGTQNNVFKGHFVGCSPESGLTIGNIGKIAQAYGIRTISINSMDEMPVQVKEAMDYPGPCVVIVKVDPFQPIEPRQASYKTAEGQMASRPLEDMRPLLPPEELARVMSVSNALQE